MSGITDNANRSPSRPERPQGATTPRSAADSVSGVVVIVEAESPAAETNVRRRWWRELAGLASSLLLHAVLLVLLASIIIYPPGQRETLRLAVENADSSTQMDDLTEIRLPQPTEMASLAKPALSDLASALDAVDPQPFNPRLDTLEVADLRGIPQINLSSHFGGRSVASREQLLNIFGGTQASEQAVQKGLRWLAERQREDGSWSFDHRRPRDRHNDHQAGTLRNCPIGATALALMAFLGAGETQTSGQYQKEVGKAVEFLLLAAVKVREGADLRGRVNDEVPGGNYPMYAHGLATIALCECYAMTRDRKVRIVAQAALDFIVQHRNREQGGWRYQPEQAGDLSVSGWMIMALQSGRSGGLRVSEVGFSSSSTFLDAVQQKRGTEYAYVAGQGPKLSTTAIGLLCRMYLGWERNLPALDQGLQVLHQAGPSPDNIYYNYYATQVLHHAGGSLWPVWNEKMREQLVASQVRRGPEAGSWDVTDPHGTTGGRLYQTCLSIMTLEVYYRHLPLYQMQR